MYLIKPTTLIATIAIQLLFIFHVSAHDSNTPKGEVHTLI